MSLRKRVGLALALLAIVLVGHRNASAQAPPSGATGKCNDGTFTTAAKKWQACGKHKGVAAWFADSGTAAPAAPKPAGTAVPATPAAPVPNSAVAPTATSLATPGSSSTTKAVAKRPVAPGGGPGLVWVNTESKIYHCPGSEDYGTTKAGKYMSEADARQAGARPNRNVPCTK